MTTVGHGCLPLNLPLSLLILIPDGESSFSMTTDQTYKRETEQENTVIVPQVMHYEKGQGSKQNLTG